MKVNILRWPYPSRWAFGFTSDTDNTSLEATRFFYDYCLEKGMYPTKTVWTHKPQRQSGVLDTLELDSSPTLEDIDYKEYSQSISQKGIEFCLHDVSAGNNLRDEIIRGFAEFREVFGYSPRLHICHGLNQDHPYWSLNHFKNPLLKFFGKFIYGRRAQFSGEDPSSPYYWSDICRRTIKYLRLCRESCSSLALCSPMQILNYKTLVPDRQNVGSRKLKILHIITRLVVGGAQDNTLLTISGHDRTRFTVHLASNPEGAWIDRAVQAADTFHPLPHLNNPIHPTQDFKAITALVSLLRQERFDIVHTHSSKAGILGRIAARIAGVPAVVHTIHGFPFHDFMPAWKRQLYINLERSVRPCTDFFITVCELNRQEAVKLGLLSQENSQTVYSGIDFAKLDRPSNLQQTRQQLEIPDGWNTIVMVGRLDEQKAPYYLVDAFSRVLNQNPNTLLLFVGEGELEDRLQRQASQLGIEKCVRFLGAREDVPEILKVADIFALSSLWEGLGRAMTEAMLLGKSVVVPNIYGIPETVHQNQTGLLFPAGDVEQLAEHLIYLLQYPQERDRLGQNAKVLTRKLFDADLMVQNIEKIYETVLSGKLA